MSVTFTKLFASITESTVWCEPDRTRLCWITMLAMADQRGRVWASIPGLANRARIPVEDARIAIAAFLAPDPDSRTSDYEGRRIETIDGGWRLLNYQKYREIRDEESRKEYQREWDRTNRARGTVNPTKSDKSDKIRPNVEEEVEVEGKPKTKAQRFALPPWIAEEAWKGFETMRTKIRKPMTDRAKVMIVLELDKLRAQGHDPIAVLAQSEVRAWASVYPIDAGKAPRSTGGEALKNWHAPKDDEEEHHASQ